MAPPGYSRQAGQECRVQTSCGRSLQPPPALALAFLQADVNARHREVVCALIRLNEVPEKHAANQQCPRSPPADMPKPLQGRAVASRQQGPIWHGSRHFPGKAGWKPSSLATLRTQRGPFLADLFCSAPHAHPTGHPTQSHRGWSGSVPKSSRTGWVRGDPWARRHLDALGFPPLQATTQCQGSPGSGHNCSTV